MRGLLFRVNLRTFMSSIEQPYTIDILVMWQSVTLLCGTHYSPCQSNNGARELNYFQGEACPYGEACTFCYNKEEEEIWTWERRGLFNRNRLFVEIIKDPINHYLKQYNYYFYKLCKTCIDEQKYDQINCQQKPQCQQKQSVSCQ